MADCPMAEACGQGAVRRQEEEAKNVEKCVSGVVAITSPLSACVRV